MVLIGTTLLVEKMDVEYVTAEADVLLKERSTLIIVFGVGTEEERADSTEDAEVSTLEGEKTGIETEDDGEISILEEVAIEMSALLLVAM